MVRKIEERLEDGDRVILAGDYLMNTNKKLLVNVGDARKTWLEKVASSVEGGSVTEVMKTVLDDAMKEDPGAFATKVQKHRLKSQLEDIENQERELEEKKQRLINSLHGKGQDGKNQGLESRSGRITA